jgi:hypothetical protein
VPDMLDWPLLLWEEVAWRSDVFKVLLPRFIARAQGQSEPGSGW